MSAAAASCADQAAKLDQRLSLGDLAISPAPARDSGEAAAVTRDLLSEILEDVIKQMSTLPSEEAVPGPEPEPMSALVEVNCPGSDHSYARVAEEAVCNPELDMVVEDCTALPLQVSGGDSSQARVATVTMVARLSVALDGV